MADIYEELHFKRSGERNYFKTGFMYTKWTIFQATYVLWIVGLEFYDCLKVIV